MICVFLAFLCWGCAGMKDATRQPKISTPSFTPVDPNHLLNTLGGVNADLTSFKGLGKITIKRANGLQITRVAWAGYLEEKLRIEILGPGGRPISSVAYDGSRFYLSLHSENRFYQRQSRHADLGRLLSIPISVKDALSILSGKAPLLGRAEATIERNASENAVVLTLEKGWLKKRTGKIYLRNDLKTIWKYELYEAKEKLVYRVEFLKYRRIENYLLPVSLLFSDGLHTTIQIEADRIWPDPDLPSSIFSLKPPG